MRRNCTTPSVCPSTRGTSLPPSPSFVGAGSASRSTRTRKLATVTGQDVEESDDGVFRIARKVAKNRTISTVDPDARHGHKTTARGSDGYKGHIALDPDSEIITATTATAGNTDDTQSRRATPR
jgi:hypothetical protein